MKTSEQGELFAPSQASPPKEGMKGAAQLQPQPLRAQTVRSGEPPSSEPAWRRGESRGASKALTVSQLTAQIKDILEPQFSPVLVRGEVSNFRGANARGHLYFALKDQRASIDIKLWSSQAQRLKFALKDGLAVIVEGNLDVYEPQGRYSLIASRIEPEGVGAQALAFEQLKAKLAAEGLLGDKRVRPRRPLPFLPRRIGVVTSVTGAALRDFLKVLHRRHPRMPVLVADARMQGEGAVPELRRALRWLSQTDVDVIVVTRGGGSVEDLAAFNEEALVRAVWHCPVPVVSAVGHEIDTTLCDLVADMRAPTPSAAAEVLVPQLLELEAQLASLKSQLARAVDKTVLRQRSELQRQAGALGDPRRELSSQRLVLSNAADRLTRVLRRKLRLASSSMRELAQRLQRVRPQAQLEARRSEVRVLRGALAAHLQRRLRADREQLGRLALQLERISPRPTLFNNRQQLGSQAQRLWTSARGRVWRERERLAGLGAQLDSLSPLKVLGRGYAIVRTAQGRIVRRSVDTSVGQELSITLGAGDRVVAQVTQVKPSGK